MKKKYLSRVVICGLLLGLMEVNSMIMPVCAQKTALSTNDKVVTQANVKDKKSSGVNAKPKESVFKRVIETIKNHPLFVGTATSGVFLFGLIIKSLCNSYKNEKGLNELVTQLQNEVLKKQKEVAQLQVEVSKNQEDLNNNKSEIKELKAEVAAKDMYNFVLGISEKGKRADANREFVRIYKNYKLCKGYGRKGVINDINAIIMSRSNNQDDKRILTVEEGYQFYYAIVDGTNRKDPLGTIICPE